VLARCYGIVSAVANKVTVVVGDQSGSGRRNSRLTPSGRRGASRKAATRGYSPFVSATGLHRSWSSCPPPNLRLRGRPGNLANTSCRIRIAANATALVLTGGVPKQIGPLGHDLNFLEDWKLAEFVTTTRTRIDPNGHEPSEEMPRRPIGRMDDDELAAVYEFLAHLPVLNMPAIYRATRLPCASRYRCYWT